MNTIVTDFDFKNGSEGPCGSGVGPGIALSGADVRTLAGVITEGLPIGATGRRTSSLSTSALMLPAKDSTNLRCKA